MTGQQTVLSLYCKSGPLVAQMYTCCWARDSVSRRISLHCLQAKTTIQNISHSVIKMTFGCRAKLRELSLVLKDVVLKNLRCTDRGTNMSATSWIIWATHGFRRRRAL